MSSVKKYLKLSVSLAFHLLPFPKLKKFIRQTHSLFFCFYIEQWNYHLPKCSPLCFHRCFQVCPDAVPLASSYLTQSLPDSSIFPYVLVQVSLQLGSVPGTRQPKQSYYLCIPIILYFPYHSSCHEDYHCFKHSLPFDKTILIGGCCVQLSA